MRELIVVRHGVAVEHGTPGIPDDLRPLTPKGHKAMRKVARGLGRLGVKPDRVLSSPLPRAIQTARIVADRLGLNESDVEETDALGPDRTAEEMRDWLLERSEDSILIVGHNPGFSRLVDRLTGGDEGAGWCELDKGGVAWFRADAVGRLQLAHLLVPKVLRRIKE
jgi:phosphohistidine phosphatase